ncbi:MAG: oxidoreductase, partial [Gemmatimonadota bacterium]
GLGLRAGAIAHNLTESQFGMASVGFRWNLSGSYQQVVPRYVSTAVDGDDEREFLNAHFPDMTTLANAIFRKGYEWPFDCEKIHDHGSSLIDLLVHRESESLGRKVYLDYARNPQGGDGLDAFALEMLDDEAHSYLAKSDALADTPIDRLTRLNEPAVALYRDNGIDMTSQRIEIAVCAQHNNGGLRANLWWESNLRHLFPVGEVCGTHGVKRPGGAALNSGQVGSLRAALYIVHRYDQSPMDLDAFQSVVEPQILECVAFCDRMCSGEKPPQSVTPASVVGEIQVRMSNVAAHIRVADRVSNGLEEAWQLARRVRRDLHLSSAKSLPVAFRAVDLCITHVMFLEALKEYLDSDGRSRGSFVVLEPDGELPTATLDDQWRFRLNETDARVDREVLEIQLDDQDQVTKQWVSTRSLPDTDQWFEKMWREYRSGSIIE